LGFYLAGSICSKHLGISYKYPAGYVDSISVGGRVINNVKVAIAPRADIGVGSLGYDILGDNYFVRIKPDVVEFSPRG
jgi:aspartyl protease family protein